MKNLFILFAFVTSVAVAKNVDTEKLESTSAYRLCATLTTSCGPSGDVCGADADELARNAAWAEDYWCGD